MFLRTMMKQQIEQDIWDWIKNYIEVDNKFYDYKFPPCPYAKSARLKGLVDVQAYETGKVKQFISEQITDLVSNNQYNVRVLVFPPRTHWHFGLQRFLQDINKTIVSQDYYAQFGTALQTTSQYSGWFNSGPYFIVIINKLSEVLSGHQALANTAYYKSWSQQHYHEVVTRRQKIFEESNDQRL
jgi:hypothetical protein